MPTGIEIPIGAPLDQLTKDLKNAQSKLKQSIGAMQDDLTRLKTISEGTLDPKKLASYNAQIQTTQNEIKRLSNVGKEGFDEFGNSIAKSNNGLTKAFSGLRTLAYIVPGIGIAGIFNLAFEALIPLVQELDIFKAKMTESSAGAGILAKAFTSSEYSKAVENVAELKSNIELAKEGIISKDEVVKQYNETIGKTTGLVNNISEAESGLAKNAPAYIKLTLLKAEANEALAEATKKGIEKEKLLADDQLSFTDKLKDFGKTATGAALGIQGNPLFDGTLVTRIKAAGKAQGEQNTLLNIFNKLNKQAAEIAKANHFNVFGDNKPVKVEKQKLNLNPSANNIGDLSPGALAALIPDTSELAAKVNEGISHIGGKTAQGVLRSNLAMMGEIAANYSTSITKILDDLTLAVNTIINTELVDAFEGIGAAIGNSLSGAGSLFQNLGAALLGSISGVLGQFGKLLVTTGVSALALQTVIKNPLSKASAIGAIAAGVGLLALSAVARGAANKIGSNAMSNANGGGYQAASPGSGINVDGTSIGGGGSFGGEGRVVFEISGVNLYGVLNRAGYKLARIGP